MEFHHIIIVALLHDIVSVCMHVCVCVYDFMILRIIIISDNC